MILARPAIMFVSCPTSTGCSFICGLISGGVFFHLWFRKRLIGREEEQNPINDLILYKKSDEYFFEGLPVNRTILVTQWSTQPDFVLLSNHLLYKL